MPSACNVCNAPNRDELEVLGAKVMAGDGTWTALERQSGISRQSLRTHMENHVLTAAEAEADAQFQALVDQTKDELMEIFVTAPADVKPLILVALRQLDVIHEAKASAEVLIKALKTVQEMTGMKNEQRLLLDFARAPRAIPSTSRVVRSLPAPAEA